MAICSNKVISYITESFPPPADRELHQWNIPPQVRSNHFAFPVCPATSHPANGITGTADSRFNIENPVKYNISSKAMQKILFLRQLNCDFIHN